MPPAKAKRQPSAEARDAVVAWIGAVRKLEATRNAGDPGPVPARRLSNAEYDYTIRDLTGVDIRPTREFPVDPANEAGVRQLGRVAGDVAGPGEEVPGGRARRRRPPRPQARRLGLRPAPDARRHRPRQVLRPPDHRLLQAAADRLRRLLPRRLAVPAPRGPRHGPTARSTASPPRRGSARRYLATIWSVLDRAARGGRADRRDPGRSGDELPRPGRGGPDAARAGCERMRDFVVELREQLDARGQEPDRAGDQQRVAAAGALEEPPVRRQPEAVRRRRDARSGRPTWAWTARRPGRWPSPRPGGRERFEATFARFCSTFPDAFYVSERARVYLDPKEDKGNAGRLLERRLPQHDGLLPRRRPALRADPRRGGAARAGRALAGVRLHHRRPDAAVLELPLVRAGRDQLPARGRVRLRPRRGQGRGVRGQDQAAGRGLPGQGAAGRGERPGDPRDRGPVPDHLREHPPGRADRSRGRAEPRRGPPAVRRAGLPPSALEGRAPRASPPSIGPSARRTGSATRTPSATRSSAS